MMSKVSALIFALVALNAANVLAAPSNAGRDVQVNGSESGHSLAFSESVVPGSHTTTSTHTTAPGPQRTKGHENNNHPRLWDDRYCKMPAHNHNGPQQQHPNQHPKEQPHNNVNTHTSSTHPGSPVPPKPTPAKPTPAPVHPAVTTHPAATSTPASNTGDMSGSFEGNQFSVPDGSDLNASHHASTATSSSSDEDDTLQIQT